MGGIKVLLRHELVFDERLHAIKRQFCIAYCSDLLSDFRPARSKVGLGLIDGMLVIHMIDLNEQLIGGDEIALVHVEFGDVPVHSGKNVDDLMR